MTMNINLNFEEIPDDSVDGEYGIPTLDIYIDKDLSYRTQRTLVIHAIVENFCVPWTHEIVEQLVAHIEFGLNELDEYHNNIQT